MGCLRSSPIHWFSALLMLVLPIAAFAALGENESAIPAEQAQMRASLRVTRTANYAVHEMQTPAGHVIRQYASPTGTVFGVTWQGPSKPDLRQLLGAHFDEFIQAAQTNRHGHGPLTINQPGLVVQSGGHMRAFTGRAYLPQMLPQGVRAEDIQ